MSSIDLRSLPGYTTSRLAFYAMNEQAHAGVQFDQEAARALVERIGTWMRSIEEEVEPKLPERELNKGEQKELTLPAKPFKKDGTLSATMEKWLERFPEVELVVGAEPRTLKWRDGKFYTIEGSKELPGKAPITLDDQSVHLKTWLMSLGWIPTMWNLKRDKRGKPVRDDRGKLIKTSPKISDKGVVCPNLLLIGGDYSDMAKQLANYFSIKNRLGVVNGWLNNERLAFDGRLGAGSHGYTNTYRFKGSVVVNVPKAQDNVILGKEMRSLFIARPGRTLVGFDASALEDKIKCHFVMPYPGGKEYVEEIIRGDPHYRNTFAFFPEQLAEAGLKWGECNKDTPEFKPFRERGKAGGYCLSYGGGPPRLATTLGLPPSQGETLYEAFWEANGPLKALRDNLEKFWETTGEKKWIKGIDGRRVQTRSRHSLINTLFQSSGACAMEVSGLILDKWLGGWTVDDEGFPCFKYKGHTIYRCIMQHDEYQYDCPEEIAEEIGQLGVKSITEAGRFLNLRVELGGSYAIARTWEGTH